MIFSSRVMSNTNGNGEVLVSLNDFLPAAPATTSPRSNTPVTAKRVLGDGVQYLCESVPSAGSIVTVGLTQCPCK